MTTHTLEEQIDGLQGLITSSAAQYTVKTAILETLNRLRAMRNSLRTGDKIDNDKFANDLATVLGEPPRRRSS